MLFKDDEPSGCRKVADRQKHQNIDKINFYDRKMRLIEINDTTNMRKQSVGHIFHEILCMRKSCGKLMSRELTLDLCTCHQSMKSVAK